MVTYSWDNSHCGSSSDRYVVVTNSLLRVRQVHGQAVETDGKTEGKNGFKRSSRTFHDQYLRVDKCYFSL